MVQADCDRGSVVIPGRWPVAAVGNRGKTGLVWVKAAWLSFDKKVVHAQCGAWGDVLDGLG